MLGLQANPDEVLRKAGLTIEVHGHTLTDGHVHSCVQSRKAGVFALQTEIVPNDCPPDVVAYVNEQYERLDHERIIGEFLDAPLFGYHVSEVIWEYGRGGFIVPVDVIGKPQEWFAVDSENRWRFKATDKAEGEPLRDRKFIIIQHQASYTNPYGKAVLSRCYWPTYFKRELIKQLLVFTEKYGTPWFMIEHEEDADKALIDEMVRRVANMVQDGVIAIPQGSKGTIMEASKNSTDVFMRPVTFFNAEISKAILSQTLTTEQGDTGSYAMSQTHLMVRRDVVDADRRLVERAMNTLIRWMVDFNFPAVSRYPVFRMFQPDDVDAALADRDTKLYSMGWRPTAEYFEVVYGIDQRLFTLVDPAAEAQAAPAFTAPQAAAAAQEAIEEPAAVTPHATTQQETNARELAQRIGSTGMIHPDDADAAMQDVLRPVLDLIRHGRSIEEVSAKLTDIYGEMDTELLQDRFAHALFIADLTGRVSVP